MNVSTIGSASIEHTCSHLLYHIIARGDTLSIRISFLELYRSGIPVKKFFSIRSPMEPINLLFINDGSPLQGRRAARKTVRLRPFDRTVDPTTTVSLLVGEKISKKSRALLLLLDETAAGSQKGPENMPHNCGHLLSARQWNLCWSVFMGGARNKNRKEWCSASSFSAALRGEGILSAVMGLRPIRTLSTSVWGDAIPSKNADDARFAKSQQQQQPQQSQPQKTLRIDPSQQQRKSVVVVAAKVHQQHEDLVARTKYLEDVALGIATDGKNTVRLDDYFDVINGWLEVATTEECAKKADKNGAVPSSSTSSLGGLDAARQARSLVLALERNLDPEHATSTVLVPITALYDLMWQVYAVCGGGHLAALEAQEVLDRVQERARARIAQPEKESIRWIPTYPEPSLRSYNIVLSCWAKANCQDAGIRAVKVFALMEEWRRDCLVALQNDPSFPYQGCYPNTITISTLIHALTTSQSLQAPDRAWQLLQEVVEVQRNPSQLDHRFRDVCLEPSLFNSVIASWTRSNRGRDGAAKAEDILSLALKLHDEGLTKEVPCKRTYALVLDAWAKCENSTGDCAQRAHDILLNMIRLYRQGVPIEFDVNAFGACIAAWSRCANVRDAPEKAEAILQELLSLHDETGLADFEPTFVVWNSLQAVWLHATKRTDAIDRCSEIIQRMQKHGCQPSMESYSKILHTAARRGRGSQALALLELYALSSNAPLYRHVRSLNAVLEALARESRHGALDRATAFFEMMKFQESYANPNVYSYSILLDALLRSEGMGCRHAERGRGLLEEMMQRFRQGEQSCRPDTHIVSAVLKLCGGTMGTEDERGRALEIALETFWTCESIYGVPPNYYVYNETLLAIDRLAASKDQRMELLEKVFEECQAGGHVSVVTFNIMRRGGAGHCLSRLTAHSSRHVPHRDRPTLDFGLRRGGELRPDGSR